MRRSGRFAIGAIALWAASATACSAADSYPFEGSWVRSDRQCTASSTRERIYTGREVTSNRSRCIIRRVATGSNATFELFERCERPNERPYSISETIRMTGPDSMVLTRSTNRLKISRSLHFSRCSIPPAPAAPPKPGPRLPH